MAVRYLRGPARYESGKTVGACSACNLEFTSGAPDMTTARYEVQMMFDAHTCLAPKEVPSDGEGGPPEKQGPPS